MKKKQITISSRKTDGMEKEIARRERTW